MVAFSFQARFVVPIELRTKTQTIRRQRVRNALPGDLLQLQRGDRFHPVRIGLARCTVAGPISLRFDVDEVLVRPLRTRQDRLALPFGARHPANLDAFAVRDGFADWSALKAFWRETHGVAWPKFEGWITVWEDTFRGPLEGPPPELEELRARRRESDA